MEKILAIGAHTDDIEIMCGSTLYRFKLEARNIFYCTFSYADKSLPDGFPVGATRKELVAATEVLGIKLQNRRSFNYDVRTFPTYRQEILEDLIKLRNEIKPDLVLTHNSNDTHQDHKTISDEVFRAFKQSSSIWGFESFKNNRVFMNDLYVTLGENHIIQKLEAVDKYKSQLVKVDNKDAIVALAKFRGAQINAPYAECFEVMRTII